MQWTASPCENMISSWGSWGLPGGWIPLGHAWCPPGTSLSSWLDFRGVPLSRWTQSSYNSRQRSWPHSLPSRGSGTSKPFWWEKCLVFGPAYSHVVLRPRPGYVIKVPSTPFRDQVVNLQALPWGRSSLGIAVSRKNIARICGPHPELQKLWAALCLPQRSTEREGCLQAKVGPLDSGCHRPCVPISRRAVPPGDEGSLHSYALAHGASLADICRAVGWATPNTFARFYSIRIEPVSSRVMGNR